MTAPSGELLYVRIIGPDVEYYPGKCFPLLVHIPGGIGDGGPTVDIPLAMELASRGMFFVAWNAEGRGSGLPGNLKSGGTEDFNGFRSQDGLKAIIEFTSRMDGVDKDNIGVMAESYGITMAAGCLGRYPEILVKYLIDVEGPSDSFATMREAWLLDSDTSNDDNMAYTHFQHHSIETDPSTENRAFWAERQANLFIGGIKCKYLRVQGQWDHSQPPSAAYPTGFDQPPVWYQNKHAIDMVNAAIDGGVPWVAMNRQCYGNLQNIKYDNDNQPFWVPGTLADNRDESIFAVIEMAEGKL